MNWSAHTHHWTLETGASVWLISAAKGQTVPPRGVDLPILLGDGTVLKTLVSDSSACRIVIELDSGHLRRLAPEPGKSSSPARFPGTCWIVQRRV